MSSAEKTNISTTNKRPFQEQDRITPKKKISNVVIYGLITSFNHAIRATGLYPPNHPALSPIITGLYQDLSAILVYKELLTFFMSADKLLLEGKVLEANTSVYKDFAKFMNDREIAKISIKSDIDMENLKIFLREISAEPKVIKKNGGIFKVINDKGVSQIELEKIDYEEIIEKEMVEQKKEEDEIEDEKEQQKKFIINYLKGKISNLDELQYDVLLRYTTEFPLFKEIITDMIDSARMPDGSPVLSFQADILIKALQKINDILLVAPPARKKKIIENMTKIVYGMDPDLRLQLLLSPVPHGEDENVLDLIARNFSHKEISDILANLLVSETKMTDRLFGVLKRLIPQDTSREKILPILQNGLKKNELQNGLDFSQLWNSLEEVLLDRGEEKYLSEDYQESLERISTNLPEDMMTAEDKKELAPYFSSIEKNQIKSQAESILIELFYQERDETEYVKLCNILLQKVKDFFEGKEYSRALNILEVFRHHASKSPDLPSSLQKKAGEILKDLAGSKTITNLAPLMIIGDVREVKIVHFIFKTLRGSAVPYLIDYLGEEKNRPARFKILKMIGKYKISAAPYLNEGLKDKRWYLVRNLVLLLGEMGESKVAKDLLSALKHNDPRVRLETVRALGKLGGSLSIRFLSNALKDKDEKVRNTAIRSISVLKNKEVTAFLIKFISDHREKRKESNSAKEAIRALGEIGSEEAASALLDIFKKKTWFFRKKDEEFRVLAAEALSKIGTEQAIDALKTGAKERRKIIREKCRELLETK